MVVVGRDLDKVQADDGATLGKSGEQLEAFIVDEAAVRGRAGSGRDGRIKAVDVDGDVVSLARRNAGSRPLPRRACGTDAPK